MILSIKQEKQQLWIQRKIHWIHRKLFLTEREQCPLLDCSLWMPFFQRKVLYSKTDLFSL